jgi:hypothetical protein
MRLGPKSFSSAQFPNSSAQPNSFFRARRQQGPTGQPLILSRALAGSFLMPTSGSAGQPPARTRWLPIPESWPPRARSGLNDFARTSAELAVTITAGLVQVRPIPGV